MYLFVLPLVIQQFIYKPNHYQINDIYYLSSFSYCNGSYRLTKFCKFHFNDINSMECNNLILYFPYSSLSSKSTVIHFSCLMRTDMPSNQGKVTHIVKKQTMFINKQCILFEQKFILIVIKIVSEDFENNLKWL